MLNIGAGEIAVILVLALLILGPTRLPELARGIGKFLREFRRQTDEVRSTIETEFYRMDRDVLREEFRKNPPALPSVPVTPGPTAAGMIGEAEISGPLDGGRKPADEIAPPVGAANAFATAAPSLPPALKAAAEETRAAGPSAAPSAGAEDAPSTPPPAERREE